MLTVPHGSDWQDWVVYRVKGLKKKIYSNDRWEEIDGRFHKSNIDGITFLTDDEAKKYEDASMAGGDDDNPAPKKRKRAKRVAE